MADISHHVISALVDDTDTIIDTSYSVLQASALTRDESVQKATCALLYQFSWPFDSGTGELPAVKYFHEPRAGLLSMSHSQCLFVDMCRGFLVRIFQAI